MGNKGSTKRKAKKKEAQIDIDARFSQYEDETTKETKKLGVEDFDIVKVLGKGSFGKVMLVRKKATNRLYAMKTLRKDALVKRNQMTHTKTERMILQTMQHPFLMTLQFAFQSEDKLYMVLEYMKGGELFHWLRQAKRFTEDRAKLYGAEILLALAHLHSHDIVYRDLKPENILMDEDGHLRLTDFGLSKESVSGAGAEGGTKTFCGTPEYLAPEILENKGHGKAVDWWSLGVLIYEMMVGRPPFYDKNMQKMYSKILRDPLKFPSAMGTEAKNLLRQLLERQVANRLGSDEAGAANIKAHPFWDQYKDEPLDWDKVLSMEYVPEFIPPRQRGSIDVTNFDSEFTRQEARDSLVPDMSNTMKEKGAIEGFTFVGDSAIEGEGEKVDAMNGIAE